MSDGNFLTKFADWAKKRYYDPLAEMGQEAGQAIREKTGRDPTLGEALGVGAKAGAESLGTGLYGGANEFLAGIPDAAVKAIARAAKSDAYEKLKETRKKYALTSDIGRATGLAASMAVPAGTVLKGASVGAKAARLGKVASALEKGAEIASGAKKVGEGAGLLGRIGGAAARGALTGAEQAIPRGIATAIGEGDIGKGAKEAALGVGLGGLIGGGTKALGEGLKGIGSLGNKFALSEGVIGPGGDIKEPIREALTKAELKGRFPDLMSKDSRKAITELAKKTGYDVKGSLINRPEELYDEMLKLAKDKNLRGDKVLKQFIQGEGPEWQAAFDKAAEAGVTPTSVLSPAMQEGGEIAQFMAEHPEDGAEVIANITKAIDKSGGDIRQAKASIDKLIGFYNGKNSPGGMASENAPALLHNLKDKLNEAVAAVSPEMRELLPRWKTLQPFRQMLARTESDIGGAPFTSGTFEKQALQKAIQSFSTSGAAGGGVGALLGGIFGPAGALLGGIGGAAINKLGPKLANFSAGEIASKLNNPKAIEALQLGLNKVRGFAGKAEQLAGKVMPGATEAAEKLTGMEPQLIDRAKGEEEPEKEASAAQATESATALEQAQEAKAEVNSKWADRVADNVKTAYYQYNLESQGLSLEDWVSVVREVTNDFDPIASAEIVFPDKAERTAFLKDYNTALQLKNVDMGAALGPGSAIPFLPPADGTKTAKAQLEDFIARLAGQDPILMDAKKRKQISAMISKISKGEGSTAEKQKALLDSLQANYGVNFGQLSDLGLLGVS